MPREEQEQGEHAMVVVLLCKYFQGGYFSEPDVIIKCIQYTVMAFCFAYVPVFPQELLQTRSERRWTCRVHRWTDVGNCKSA